MSRLSSPHTAHPIAKISKVKDLALILSISVFSLSSLHLLSKSILSNRFATLFLLTHNRLMRCSFSVVNKVAVVALLLTWFLHHCWQRIFNKNTNYFSDVYILHSLSYAVWNFHLNWLTFYRSYDGCSRGPLFIRTQCITNCCTHLLTCFNFLLFVMSGVPVFVASLWKVTCMYRWWQ